MNGIRGDHASPGSERRRLLDSRFVEGERSGLERGADEQRGEIEVCRTRRG